MCDCNCDCSCCCGPYYKPSGGGWLVWVCLIGLLTLPFHGWLTLLLIGFFWPWLLGALALWAGVKLVGWFARETRKTAFMKNTPPPRAPEHGPDCNYRGACETEGAAYQSCSCGLDH